MDPHWLPIHLIAKPCVIPYNFIGKFETLHEDMEHVLKEGFRIRNTTSLPLNFNSMEKHTNTTVMTKYYGNVPKHHVEKLKEIYKIDFEMFGYSNELPVL